VSQNAAFQQILDQLRGEPSRTWSIIVTLYGDAIMPRGGQVWLGAISAFCQGMGIGEGVVRTAMSRLAADGWVERNRVGRNSFYALAERGRAVFGQAAARIYHPQAPAWSGRFTALLTVENLIDAGFGSPSAGFWIAPGGTKLPPEASDALCFTLEGDAETQRALAARAWPLEETARGYRRFLDRFEPLRAAEAEKLSDLEAMIARVLLIHDYRRIILRDPLLPAAILPLDWPGEAARALCADLYPRLLPGSERWLDATALDESGAPPPPDPHLARRFQPEA
jgi:phenylacetic acid degradation operon negative regulatory protein